jgi:hypothetical protein
MSGPFKMKGWSPFTQKTHPKHPVTPPTEEESKKSKGELFERDLTGFRRHDRVGTKAEQKVRRSKSQNLFYEGGKIIWRKIKK